MKYKFRAETIYDADSFRDKFLKMLADTDNLSILRRMSRTARWPDNDGEEVELVINLLKRPDPNSKDFIIKFDKTYVLESLRKIMQQVDNGHEMWQTIAFKEDYTASDTSSTVRPPLK